MEIDWKELREDWEARYAYVSTVDECECRDLYGDEEGQSICRRYEEEAEELGERIALLRQGKYEEAIRDLDPDDLEDYSLSPL